MAPPTPALLPSLPRPALAWALCASALLLGDMRAARAADGGAAATGVSVKILNARAPPGGVVQLALTLTEPTPIMTSRLSLSFSGTGSVIGVAAFSPGATASDVSGAAVIRGQSVSVRTTSPSAQFGTAAGVPILTLALAIPPTAAKGTNGTFALDPAASLWLDPFGQPYAQQVKNATYQVAGAVSIGDVFPGMGFLPAGSTVAVKGIGFQPGAIVEIDGVPVASTAFVSSTELDATIAAGADLYGRTVRVRNPDFSQAEYYAYLRAAWVVPSACAATRSCDPLVEITYPVFSPQTFTHASFTIPAADTGQFLAVAVQNPTADAATVALELLDATGAPFPSPVAPSLASLALPPRSRASRTLSELFPTAPPGASFVVVRSTATPIQVLGMIGDHVAGTMTPLVPALAFP